LLYGIESFIWFDIQKEQDWRVGSTPQSAEAMREALKDERFEKGLDLLPEIVSQQSIKPAMSLIIPAFKLKEVKKTGRIGDDGVSVEVTVLFNAKNIPGNITSLSAFIVTNREWPAGAASIPSGGAGEVVFFSYLHPANTTSSFIVKGFDENGKEVFRSQMFQIPFPR